MFDRLDLPLPHYNSRNQNKIQAVITHCLGFITVRRCLEALDKSELSAHYFVPQESLENLQIRARKELSSSRQREPLWSKILTLLADHKAHYPKAVPVFQLVPDDKRAWHAGKSHWRDWTDLNSCTIGIEFHCPLYGRKQDPYYFKPYNPLQAQTGSALVRYLITTHKIDPTCVLAHSDIAWDRYPEPKTDPGPTFFWKELHEAGIGYLPSLKKPIGFSFPEHRVRWVQQRLHQVGYTQCPITGILCFGTQRVLDAYRMHFLTEESFLLSKLPPYEITKDSPQVDVLQVSDPSVQITELLMISLARPFPWESHFKTK